MVVQGELYLTFSDLISLGVAKGTYDYWVSNKCITLVSNPSDKRVKWVLYDSIPAPTRKKLPSKESLIAEYTKKLEITHGKAIIEAEKQEFEQKLSELQAFCANYTQFFAEYLKKYAENQALELAKAASVLVGISELMKHEKSKTAYCQSILPILQQLNLKYLQHNNFRRLYEKVNALSNSTVYDIVSLPREGNQNRLLFDLTHQTIILYRYADAHVPTKTEAYEQYCKDCLNLEMQPLAKSTFVEFLNKPEIAKAVLLWRIGKKAWNNSAVSTISRLRTTQANYQWCMDAWTFEVYYDKDRKTVIENGKTKLENAKVGRLVVSVVLDEASWFPVGWAIGFTESAALNEAAINHAIRRTTEIFGKAIGCFTLRMDNGGGNKGLQETLYPHVCKRVIPAAVGNARSKVIEPYFNWINSLVIKNFERWAGSGVKAKKESSQPSEIALKLALRNQDYSIESLKYDIDKALQVASNTVIESLGATPRELYMRAAPKVYELDLLGIARVLWSETKVTVRQSGIEITVRGTRYIFHGYHKEATIYKREIIDNMNVNNAFAMQLWNFYKPTNGIEVQIICRYDDNTIDTPEAAILIYEQTFEGPKFLGVAYKATRIASNHEDSSPLNYQKRKEYNDLKKSQLEVNTSVMIEMEANSENMPLDKKPYSFDQKHKEAIEKSIEQSENTVRSEFVKTKKQLTEQMNVDLKNNHFGLLERNKGQMKEAMNEFEENTKSAWFEKNVKESRIKAGLTEVEEIEEVEKPKYSRFQ